MAISEGFIILKEKSQQLNIWILRNVPFNYKANYMGLLCVVLLSKSSSFLLLYRHVIPLLREAHSKSEIRDPQEKYFGSNSRSEGHKRT